VFTTLAASGNISKLLETRKALKKNCLRIKHKDTLFNSVISGRMEKRCCKCKELKHVVNFGVLKKSPDGLRYDCKTCRTQYRENNKESINQKHKEWYAKNKVEHLEKSKAYRNQHIDEINLQRKEYRNRPEIKELIKKRNTEYLPIRKIKIKERRVNDINFKLKEILRSKIHKMIKGQPTSYQNIIGCDIDFLKRWIEFRFDNNMNWNNLGSYWQIDHILPINIFDLTYENSKNICFHWTNLQPLVSFENRSKSDTLQLHYYFNNIVNINRFNSINKQFLGYQILNESLEWLRHKLRYGKNPQDDNVETHLKLTISSQDSNSV